MPNKIKSQKAAAPKPNGALSTGHSAADVIAPDELKGDANRKAIKAKSAKRRPQPSDQITTTTAEAATAAVSSDAIAAVGEELLQRLRVNGTSMLIGANGSAPSANGPTAVTNDVAEHVPKTNNNNCRQVNHNSGREPNCVNSAGERPAECNGDRPTDEAAAAAAAAMTNLDGETNAAANSSDAQPATTQVSQQSQESSTSTGAPMPNAREPIHVEYHPMPSTSFACARHSALSVKCIRTASVAVTFKEYENELQMPDIMRVIQRELSEPYSIYTYRYFIHNWPKLCFLAMDGDNCIGAIVCKLDLHRQITKRGYIAMLAVDAAYRKLKVGTTLVQKSIEVRKVFGAAESKKKKCFSFASIGEPFYKINLSSKFCLEN